MAKSVTAVDGKVYSNPHPSEWTIVVVSGSPAMTYSLDDFVTPITVDLTASPTYPSALVGLPECKFKFALSGGVVQIAQYSQPS